MKVQHSAEFMIGTLAELETACRQVTNAGAPSTAAIEVNRPDGRRPAARPLVRFQWMTGDEAPVRK